MVATLSITENYIKPSQGSEHISRDISVSALPYRYRYSCCPEHMNTCSNQALRGGGINKGGVYSQIFLIFIDVVQLQNMGVFYELQNSYFSLHLQTHTEKKNMIRSVSLQYRCMILDQLFFILFW